MSRDMIFAGQLALNNTVDVTDPCYNKDVWCRITIKNMKPGIYNCYYESDVKEVITKVCRIVLDGDEELTERVRRGRSWREIAEIGVDAGLAGFFENKPDFNDDEWHDLCAAMYCSADVKGALVVPNSIPRAYLASKKNNTQFSNSTEGFWTSSGYGDGGYGVYAIRDASRHVVALEIRFV